MLSEQVEAVVADVVKGWDALFSNVKTLDEGETSIQELGAFIRGPFG